jgi:hypothetical protein
MPQTAPTSYYMKYETVSDEEAFGQAIARYAQRLEISALLEPISKLLEVHGDAGKLGKADEICGAVLPTYEETPLSLEPAQKPFNQTTTLVALKMATLLSLRRQDLHRRAGAQHSPQCRPDYPSWHKSP